MNLFASRFFFLPPVKWRLEWTKVIITGSQSARESNLKLFYWFSHLLAAWHLHVYPMRSFHPRRFILTHGKNRNSWEVGRSASGTEAPHYIILLLCYCVSLNTFSVGAHEETVGESLFCKRILKWKNHSFLCLNCRVTACRTSFCILINPAT